MNAIIIIAISGIISMFIGAFQLKRLALPIGIIACVCALACIVLEVLGDYSEVMHNMLLFDTYANAFITVMIIITIAVLVISRFYYRSNIEHLSDIYALFLFSLVGCITLVAFNNLVMLFLGLEIMSIPLYILAASNRNNLASNEAGLKYYLMGSFATCFLLLGITLIYGTAGTFDLAGIQQFVGDHKENIPSLLSIGGLLILGAFIFKVSAAPFHLWAPDVYQGSPTVITAFMATVIKTAAFGALLKFVMIMLPVQEELWKNILAVVAVITMIAGNITALYQTNFKRLLAYSGIANAGYVMIAIASLNEDSYRYILFYMLGYSVATILAFAIYVAVKENNLIDDIDGFRGLAKQNRLLTATLTVSMISLASIPPLAGFFGKYAIFTNAIAEGNMWLVVIAIINSVIGVYYYFRVMMVCFQPAENTTKIVISASYRLILLGGIFILLLLGLFPSVVFEVI